MKCRLLKKLRREAREYHHLQYRAMLPYLLIYNTKYYKKTVELDTEVSSLAYDILREVRKAYIFQEIKRRKEVKLLKQKQKNEKV